MDIAGVVVGVVAIQNPVRSAVELEGISPVALVAFNCHGGRSLCTLEGDRPYRRWWPFETATDTLSSRRIAQARYSEHSPGRRSHVALVFAMRVSYDSKGRGDGGSLP